MLAGSKEDALLPKGRSSSLCSVTTTGLNTPPQYQQPNMPMQQRPMQTGAPIMQQRPMQTGAPMMGAPGAPMMGAPGAPMMGAPMTGAPMMGPGAPQARAPALDMKIEEATLHSNGAEEFGPPTFGAIEYCATCIFGTISLPFFFCNFRNVLEYERGIVLRFGRRVNEEAIGGGLKYIIPSVDRLMKIDVRETILDIPRQSVITSEGTNLFVDGVVYYKVFDANKALLAIAEPKRAIMLLAQTKLREVMALHTYDQIQNERIRLAAHLKLILDNASERWGIDITRVELTDLKLPPRLQAAMNAEQEAKRQAQADIVQANSAARISIVDAHSMAQTALVRANGDATARVVAAQAAAQTKEITAQADKDSAEDFKRAADIMAAAPATIKLRYLQTLQEMSYNPSNTMFIPFNTDTMSVSSKAFDAHHTK